MTCCFGGGKADVEVILGVPDLRWCIYTSLICVSVAVHTKAVRAWFICGGAPTGREASPALSTAAIVFCFFFFLTGRNNVIIIGHL